MILKYDGEYGELLVDIDKQEVITDTLNRDKIWEDANYDFNNQRSIYNQIITEMLDLIDTSILDSVLKEVEEVDFGYNIIFTDESIRNIDSETTCFLEVY